MSYPYLARTTLKYKSPHATDLSFAKDETIRVTGPSDDDEDWLVGETLDGSKKGGFPKDFIMVIDEQEEAPPAAAAAGPAPEEPASDPLGEEVAGPAAGAGAAAASAKSPEPSAPPLPPSEPAPPSPRPQAAVLPATPSAAPSPGPAPAKQAGPTGEDSPAAPQSMKDRLAFFTAAQNKASPPPVKPKPAGGTGLSWSQRQKLRQEQEAKEQEAAGGSESSPAPSIPGPVTSSPAPEQTVTADSGKRGKDEGEGMSAADAQSSISKGGSLRERMAALQGAGAFGQPAAEKPTPPKPSGKVWSRPPAPEPAPGVDEEEEEGDDMVPAKIKSPSVEKDDPTAVAGDEGAPEEGEEEDEEAKEKERKAAITARLARLGARGPLGVPPPMAPKPVRKLTKEASAEAPTAPSETAPAEGAEPDTAATKADSDPTRATSPPASVPIAPIARRTAGPKRRTAAPATSSTAPQVERDDPAEGDERFERETSDGIQPPPQVMVADEEKPLPKTEEQLAREAKQEAAGQGERGAEGAKVAGIALAPASEGGAIADATGEKRIVGAVAGADSEARAAGTVTDRAGPGEIIDKSGTGGGGAEDADEEGGAEEDEILQQAKAGKLEPEDVDKPRRVGTVPLAPPSDDLPEEDEDEEAENRTTNEVEDEDVPPPPPARMLGVGKDESELKHEHEAEAEDEEEEEEDDAPPIPQRSGARLPPPPTGSALVPPRDEEQEDREAAGEGDEEAEDEDFEGAEEDAEGEDEEEDETPPPPPPARQSTLPAPVQTGLPSLATATAKSPPASPVQMKAIPPISAEKGDGSVPSGSAEDEEAKRRAGIAARMAKLGGVKIGMPPPSMGQRPAVPRSAGSEGPTSPASEGPRSPIREQEVEPPIAAATGGDEEETPEQEAARRRATLARLRAGGMLGGFNMFSHSGPKSPPAEDPRGLQAEAEEEVPESVENTQQAEVQGDDEEAAPPPPPPGRPVRSPSTVPAIAEDEDVPAPPPPARTLSHSSRDVASSPGKRPPVPQTDKRYSSSSVRGIPLATPIPEDQPMVDDRVSREPQILHEEPEKSDEPSEANSPPPPIPPGRPGRQPSVDNLASRPPPPSQTQSPAPRRSMSTASRASRTSASGESPSLPPNAPARQVSRQESVLSQSFSQQGEPRSSMSSSRPGFNDLQAASQQYGQALIRVAQDLFKQGKKGIYGDGSPTGFVTLAMQQAGLPPPQQSLGQLVFEQEGGSVLKRLDEPRPGDVAAFHDAKLKGKKGLSSYNQQAGSVEDPLVGIVVDFEQKNKRKIKVLQVERGVPEEVSYRCDDLKSGRILVYRAGI